MAQAPDANKPPAPDTKPIHADGGWSQLMRQMAVVTPARLRGVRRASNGIRSLRAR